MPVLRLRLHQADTERSFRARVQATSDVPGGRITGDFFVVTVPATTTHFTVTVTVTTADTTTVVERFTQAFVVTDTDVEADWAEWANQRRPGATHPRISGSLRPVGGTITLAVDLTFLDMTAALVAAEPAALEDYNPGYLDDSRNPDRGLPHHGCLTYAFELTRAPVPKTWFVVVPPPLVTQPRNPLTSPQSQTIVPDQRAFLVSSVDVLTFFRPSVTDHYDRVESTPVVGLISRYLIDPPVFAPFFARPPTSPSRWLRFPRAGLEGQLARSERRVLLVLPWPSKGLFGVAETTALPGLLASLVVAAHAAGIIATARAARVAMGRLGLAAYSHGGEAAVKAWLLPSVRDRCSELYLFDANNTEQLTKDEKLVRDWLARDRTRTLRMIGGALHHSRMLGFADRLVKDWRTELTGSEATPALNPPPAVWCRPTSTDHWLGTVPDATYAWALRVPPDQNNPLDPATFPATPVPLDVGTASATLSTSSGVVLDTAGTARQTKVRADGNVRTTATFFDLSPMEIAGFTESFWLTATPAPQRVTTQRRLEAFAASARNLLLFGKTAPDKEDNDLGHGIRHQWAICGGEGGPVRGPSFRGYFFLCLRDSGFSR